MFAVIKTGGRQYRVVPDDVLEIGKIAGDVGTIVPISSTSSGTTRYCRPPVLMTANIV